MTRTTICKANPLEKSQRIANQVITIDGKIPKYLTLTESKAFYGKQARAIDEALFKSLPQGTYDLLGIMFMQRKVSLYQGKTE